MSVTGTLVFNLIAVYLVLLTFLGDKVNPIIDIIRMGEGCWFCGYIQSPLNKVVFGFFVFVCFFPILCIRKTITAVNNLCLLLSSNSRLMLDLHW